MDIGVGVFDVKEQEKLGTREQMMADFSKELKLGHQEAPQLSNKALDE